jgi:CRISPR-associated protein Cas5d
MGDNGSVVLEVWGGLACFTRPELKVERFSYPVMTPSAARGVLDAIYCKPMEFGWRVNRIEILRPIRYIALRRNEVKDKISVPAVQSVMASGGQISPLIADATRGMTGSDQQGRTQRQTMALVDVHYRIHARIQPRPQFDVRMTALVEQARRRIEGGKCFYQPYLGCREFAAFFAPVAGDGGVPPQPVNLDIGYMLYDVFDLDEARDDGYARPRISLFRATVSGGVLEVPAYEDPAVRKGG